MTASATIEAVEVLRTPPRWTFVRVQDSDGLIGWGEAIVPKRAGAVEGAIRDLAANLPGAPANRIEELWSRMYRNASFRGGPVLATAAAAIDHALWDLKGRRYGLPAFEFFGGEVRDHIRAYAWIGGDRPTDVVTGAQERVRQGFSAVKMNATAELDYLDSAEKVDGVIDRVASLRNEFGDSLDIVLDFHGRVHRAMAKRLIQALDEFRLLWIEEPLAPGYEDLLREVVSTSAATPICTGERLTNRWEFRRLFEAGVVDVVNPDVSITGLSELVKICRMAEAYDIAVAPHSAQGPISLAASLQAGACAANVVVTEYSGGMHYNLGYEGLAAADVGDYLVDPSALQPVEGMLSNPRQPGLGIELDEPRLRAAAAEPWRLHEPMWRTEDGRIAEW